MIVTKEQEETFNHAMDEILSACYNLGLTKFHKVPKLKAGMEFTEEQSHHFKQIEDYAHSDLASVANDLYHESNESPNKVE